MEWFDLGTEPSGALDLPESITGPHRSRSCRSPLGKRRPSGRPDPSNARQRRNDDQY